MLNRFYPITLLMMLGLLSGCTTTHFLGQAARGQWRIQRSAIPIDQVLQQHSLPENTRYLLERIPEIKAYAANHGLQVTGNYEHYVVVEGEAVIWVVTASPALSLDPKTWSFPVAGSFNYLGWYRKKAADKHAERLRRKGLDVDVRGANAYSTLGHFRDPVFSTMLDEGAMGEASLANTLFHESVHTTIYVKGQSFFNESIAQFIANELTIEYLSDTFGADSSQMQVYRQYNQNMDIYAQQFNKAYKQLESLYASELSKKIKLTQKEIILKQLQESLQLTYTPNNASLIGYRTYRSGHKDFEQLFEASGQNWATFLESLAAIQPSDFESPHQKQFARLLDAL